MRWFTRGEFQTTALSVEDKINPDTSIHEFTRSFDRLAKMLSIPSSSGVSKRDLISIDGTPHNLWWPVQDPDGSVDLSVIPIPQLVREIQPHAKFIVTLTDPVSRMYSDYYFLG